jgi:NADPH:quinone reductase-like Zn-dependent oxidoreductase
VKLEGTIAMIGFIGGSGKASSSLEPLARVCTLRGVYVGSREQMEHMNAAIEINGIQPVVDKQVFTFDQVKEAYQYQMEQKHFGR